MTFDDQDRALLAQLADVLIPAGENMPSASQAGVAGRDKAGDELRPVDTQAIAQSDQQGEGRKEGGVGRGRAQRADGVVDFAKGQFRAARQANDAGDADRARPLRFRDEGLLGGADAAEGVAHHVAHRVPRVEHAEEVEH